MGPSVMGQVADVYRKLRFTLRFLLGNLHDFDPVSDAVPYDALPATDRFILSSFASLLSGLASSYETYQFFRVYQASRSLCPTHATSCWRMRQETILFCRANAVCLVKQCWLALPQSGEPSLPLDMPLDAGKCTSILLESRASALCLME